MEYDRRAINLLFALEFIQKVAISLQIHVEQRFDGHTHHENGGHPAGHLDMGIKKPPHKFIRIALEIAPLVAVGETDGRGMRSR
jgi:hypothetical protein